MVPILRRKPFKKFREEPESEQFIDLGELVFEDEAEALQPTKARVKVAEIARYEDLSDLTTHVYNGNILVLDYTSIANDTLTLKRVTNELKSVVKDTKGDLVGIGKNMLIVTPEGIKVDRTKIKAY